MILMSTYLLWRIFFTLPFNQGRLNIVFGILLIVAETTTVLTTFELFIQKMHTKNRQLEIPVIPSQYFPDVDVFIATHNEPVELLYKTLNAATFMDYPDKEKVHIYLCDDTNRLEVAKLAKDFNVGYFGLENNKDAKSGNLNNALSKTESPLIATFDADMIPQHTFLMKTVPYFFLASFIKDNDVWRMKTEKEKDYSYKIGLVQTPQSFYNPDLFQFNLYAEKDIPNEQDFFSREINILRNASNSVAYTGSNTVISRKALNKINGFPLNTITEDFETSIRLQQAGYITYATNEVQAKGLSTTTISAMIKQRVRWSRGVIQSLQNTNAIFSKKLPFTSKITYFNSFLYWFSFFNRLVFILSPILFALFDFQIVNTGFWGIIIFWLPSYLFYNTAMRFLSSNIRNQHWSQVVDTIFMPYLIFPVLLETLHFREKKFKVTNKNKAADNHRLHDLKYAIPHVILLILSIMALFRFSYGKYGWALFYSSVIIYWLVFNVVSLFYSIFFMLGRKSYRSSERISAIETVIIKSNQHTYVAKTRDLSDNGMSFFVSSPIYLPDDVPLDFTVKTKMYQANLTGHIVYVKQVEDGWHYSAKVSPNKEIDKRHYTQIIYDRLHSLPKQMNLWITPYDDIVRNVKNRINKTLFEKRKHPRISINYLATFENGITCTLTDFNFQYFSCSNLNNSVYLNEELVLITQSGIRVILKRVGLSSLENHKELLLVENLDNLIEENQIDDLIKDLTIDTNL